MGGGKSWVSDEILISCQAYTRYRENFNGFGQRKEIFESDTVARFSTIVASKMTAGKNSFAKMEGQGSAIAAKFKLTLKAILKFLRI